MKTLQTVNTKVPYRIDIHHHLLPRFYLEALEEVGKRITFGVRLPDWSLEAHLELMDRIKVVFGIASIPLIPFPNAKYAKDLARRCNTYLARMRDEHPTHFGAFAVLPLPDVDAALSESLFALDTLRLDGIVMMSNVNGHYVGEPANRELFAELNRKGAVVFIHPGDPPGAAIPEAIRFPIDTGLETVRAAMSLFYNGVLHRNRNLRFIFAHCGGITPFLANRIVQGERWDADSGSPDPGTLAYPQSMDSAKDGVSLLQRQYYDSMTANGHIGLQTLQAFAGHEHILLGTDHGILPPRFHPIKMRELMRYPGFDDASRIEVERINALRLFPRLQEVLG